MDARALLEVLTWTLGPLVMLTYAWLYYVLPTDTYDKRSRPWALFGDNGPYFWGWSVSVLVCVILFLHLSVWLCYFYGGTELQTHDWLLYPYGLFLGFSALYGPLLVFAMPWVVVLDLVCVAASAIGMFVWTALYLTSNRDLRADRLAGLSLHCFGCGGMGLHLVLSAGVLDRGRSLEGGVRIYNRICLKSSILKVQQERPLRPVHMYLSAIELEKVRAE
jgi:hypothetical protein